MDQISVGSQIDEHLLTIQRDTKSMLDRLAKSGLNVDKKFLQYFMKLSVDRLTQTCERYGAEAKYKMSCSVTPETAPTLATAPSLASENPTIPSLETRGNVESVQMGDNSKKRKADDIINAGCEASKRQNIVETIVIKEEPVDPNWDDIPTVVPMNQSNPIHLLPPILPASMSFTEELNRLQNFVQVQVQNSPIEPPKKPNQLKPNLIKRKANDRPQIRREPEALLIRHLIAQRKQAKTLFVKGLSRDLNITDRYGTFIELCKKLGVTVKRCSIKRILQQATGLDVEFYRMDEKNLIMTQANINYVWSNQLFTLADDQYPWKICIRDSMTYFYAQMWFAAIKLKEQNRLHQCKLTEHGMIVQRTPNSVERVVLSEQQLMEYIQSDQP